MLNKLVGELKQNKFTTVVFCIFLVMFLLGWLVFGLVMPKSGEPVYGNRLDGIGEVEVTDKQISNLEKELEGRSYVNSASVHVKGRIINVLIETKKGTKLTTAKLLSNVVIKGFEKDQTNFYDIQLFLTNESETAKGYPAIGYKNATAKKFVF